MVAYSFQSRFAEPILAGAKGGTIRAPRRNPSAIRAEFGGHAWPDETLQLYTGMRTKHCRRISDRKCLATTRILLCFGTTVGEPEIVVHDEVYKRFRSTADLDAFARFDGFADFADMAAFWHVGRTPGGPYLDVFDGWHIRWLPLPDLADA
ncbi:MAG TPA: hypothetical protein VGR45_07330 [Stellaceae bacterium]|nr:hypothetical protein [Stellaceae bacterium]